MNDIMKILQSILGRLDKDCNLIVNGQEMNVCVFTIVFLGDMLQQKKNSEFLGHDVLRFCRFCLIDKNEYSNLNYNIANLNRYHYHNQYIRAHLRRAS